MKLTIESSSYVGDKRVVTIEDNSVTNMEELTDLFISASLALGYSPKVVDAYLKPNEFIDDETEL